MQPPNLVLLADKAIPTITLGGQEWPIPKMGIKQNRVIVSRITKLLPYFSGLDAKKFAEDPKRIIVFMESLDETMFDMLGDILFAAVTRAHKDMLREEFEEMDMSLLEMFMAFPVILSACGVFVAKPEGQDASGEDKAVPPTK